MINIVRKLLAFAAVSLATASLCVATGSAGESLKIAHSTWVGFGPLYVAQEKGFFAEEGLEVDLIVMEDAKTRFSALDAGEVDVVVTTIDTVLSFMSNGHSYRYLFAIADSQGGDGIVAKKGITSVAGLKGKTVAFNPGSVSQFYLGILLREVGLSLSDVQSVDMTAGDAGATFVAGRVDAAVTWEPWLTRGAQADHGHLLVDSSTSPGLITDTALTTPAVVEARRDDLKALYRAWTKAVAWQKANVREADAIMAKGVGGWLEDLEVFAETRAGIAYYDADKNAAFIGTADKPGAIIDTITNAMTLGNEIGTFALDLDPASLVAFEVANP